jgi:hypothetical protein
MTVMTRDARSGIQCINHSKSWAVRSAPHKNRRACARREYSENNYQRDSKIARPANLVQRHCRCFDGTHSDLSLFRKSESPQIQNLLRLSVERFISPRDLSIARCSITKVDTWLRILATAAFSHGLQADDCRVSSLHAIPSPNVCVIFK